MNARFWMICALLATVLANAGCITECHRGFQKSLEHGPEYDVPTQCRSSVHVFMMHGLTPSTDSGLDALRLKLGENGFANVGIGELCHAGWVKSEINCIRRNDPDARFVLLGYDLGAATACSLARDLATKNIPVEAVVLLDPMGCSAEPCGARTLLVTSAKATSSVPHSGRIVVSNASHFGLPMHPTTVAALTELLKDIAVQNCHPQGEPVQEWTYPHAPEMRPEPVRKTGGDWDFLADRPEAPNAIGTQVATQPLTRPTAIAAPVASKRQIWSSNVAHGPSGGTVAP